MNEQLPFRTQARTVDHLGREQIADSPTAISELWKNAYDAYARNVSLHIADAPIVCAGIFDDGVGMNRSDFTDRWLVLGTTSKVDRTADEQNDTKGLPLRPAQGQKGIGRLSVGFLGPLLFLVSRKQGGKFIASLVDWRLFENPYLLLEDVRIPFAEADTTHGLASAFNGLAEDLVDNVWGRNGSPERNARVVDAWARYDVFENAAGLETPTSLQIVSAATEVEFSEQVMKHWSPWEDENETGTALLIFHIKDELRVWLKTSVEDDDETKEVKRNLRSTLTGFVDPYSDESPAFDYRVVVHRGPLESTIVDSLQQFGKQELHELEHYLDGAFDEFGVFSGRVRAFGRDMGEVTIPSVELAPGTRNTRVGPFSFAIGTFEQESKRSTHELARHTALLQQAEESSGLRIYRDSLRVMPYGRPDVDFFGIEERRTSNAGREFWQHKRIFGRIALTRSENPNLRDKAGREGFIDSGARRRLRLLVIGLLKYTARKYFGSSSEYREQWMPEIEAANKKAQKADASVRSANFKALVAHIRAYRLPLAAALEQSASLKARIQEAQSTKDLESFSLLAPEVDSLVSARSLYRPPSRPVRLGKAEEPYREYRDTYDSFTASVEAIGKAWSETSSELGANDPVSTLQRAIGRHQKLLSDDIGRWSTTVRSLLNQEILSLESRTESDRGAFYQGTRPITESMEEGRSTLTETLIALDALATDLQRQFAESYGSYERGLARLAAGIDIDVAVTWGAEARNELERRLSQLTALAQLGITVEIIGHEFETLDAQVARNLKKLPAAIRQSDAYQLALDAYQGLTTRLHFLSPLGIAGTQYRENIRGASIAEYIRSFFAEQLKTLHVEFRVSPSFNSASVEDFRYRIFPVFVNLVNNALYWVRSATHRVVMLDYQDGEMIVADTGKGVDPDDVPHLFQIFFTRRSAGRGVGLYLCKANLAASGHTIRYEGGGPSLSGANFLIRLASSLDD